jgi:hypothetical protein
MGKAMRGRTPGPMLYSSGFGLDGGGGTNLTTAPHVRHENTSKSGSLSRDLLPTMAIPQIGQCWIGGLGCDVIPVGLEPAGLVYSLKRVSSAYLVVGPIQCRSKRDKGSQHQAHHDQISCHPCLSL